MLRIGIDTGGTFTDAVLLDTEGEVRHKLKTPTTHHDLSICITQALQGLTTGRDESIAFVALSTTLATNAMVEDIAPPAHAILIGFNDAAIARFCNSTGLERESLILVDGGHDSGGTERKPLDESGLLHEARRRVTSGYARSFSVCSMFAVRNPAHELRAAGLLQKELGVAVTRSSDLADGLDAPRRAQTAWINARLLGAIQELIDHAESEIRRLELDCPLMVVKGDGSLISSDMARQRPVETLMSGPAASVIGAKATTGQVSALVIDIGGTTTDIARVEDGFPLLNEAGAMVGARRTMVKAIDVNSVGLGGDSLISLDDLGRMVIGPRRAVPLSRLAKDHPAIIEVLQIQHDRFFEHPHDGMFVVRRRDAPADMSRNQQQLWEALESGPVPVADVIERMRAKLPLEAMIREGTVIYAGLTPTDALVIREAGLSGNREAAELGLLINARKMPHAASKQTRTVTDLADEVIQRFEQAVTRAIIGSQFQLPGAGEPGRISNDPLMEAALYPDTDRFLQPQFELRAPIIGMGAPAGALLPGAGPRLLTRCHIPDHAEVCAAIGAAFGVISQAVTVNVITTNDDRFRLAGPDIVDQHIFSDADAAMLQAEAMAYGMAEDKARASGAVDISIRHTTKKKIATVEMQDMFISGSVTAKATGRPPLVS